jgi:hypothetical protein
MFSLFCTQRVLKFWSFALTNQKFQVSTLFKPSVSNCIIEFCAFVSFSLHIQRKISGFHTKRLTLLGQGCSSIWVFHKTVVLKSASLLITINPVIRALLCLFTIFCTSFLKYLLPFLQGLYRITEGLGQNLIFNGGSPDRYRSFYTVSDSI